MNQDSLDPAEIVSSVSLVYADYNAQHAIVKPRSSLPCSWFAARECFMIAYEREYLELPEQLRDSYHHVYAELSFFLDDESVESFESSLNTATTCYSNRCRSLGLPVLEEVYCRKYLAGTVLDDRKGVWTHLGKCADLSGR
jgi:hypothetical protein